ncbi:gibberellin 2-beta-dioxygenase 8-like [Malania oleifera]|uniref:gibberellin 2-beta-dioxygenase 8-like n=1 Tax=Malania oleifera TaxID=397392 RepID=UPI0025AE30C8|nr:gibberellin 2-beta-dioxygenase 8-like [Malania oleifera]
MESYPPFHENYKSLLEKPRRAFYDDHEKRFFCSAASAAYDDDDEEEEELVDDDKQPPIDLSRLKKKNREEREGCKRQIAEASSRWGFFQVVNHGVPPRVLERMRHHQVQLFHQPFHQKAAGKLLHSASAAAASAQDHHHHNNTNINRYSWGTPTATCLTNLSWSESFHIPLHDILGSAESDSFRSTVEEFSSAVYRLALRIAKILAENLGCESNFFAEHCLPSSCYLRLNRYPPCPFPSEVFGIVPHTDSDFLTVLHQDQIGGLQLLKDEKWFNLKPNPEALTINIGDLFQAWSNDVYKSVEHRAKTNQEVERFSTAFFMCPAYDAIIESCSATTTTASTGPSLYKKFSFGQYRQQVQDDVKATGNKIGLSRFRL